MLILLTGRPRVRAMTFMINSRIYSTLSVTSVSRVTIS